MKKSNEATLPLFAVCVFLLMLCAALSFFIDGSADNTLLIKVAFILISCDAALIVLLFILKKMTSRRLFILVFVGAFLVFFCYGLYTNYWVRQHDVQSFDKNDGHAGYIKYLLENNFELPYFDPRKVYQFYHPPLYHFMAAVWMKAGLALGHTLQRAAESLQFLSLFFASCSVAVARRIITQFDLSGFSLDICSCLICLHPTFMIFSGSINNDVLALLLVLLAVLFTLRWYKSSSLLRIIPIALSVGLAMTTKLSGALVAPAIAFVFLAKLIKNRRNKPLRLIGQYSVFGAVCVPLGLWWTVRCYSRFGMPLGYVPLVGGAESEQYVGNFGVLARLSDIQLRFPYISLCYFNNYAALGEPNEHNVFLALIKTSLFGEWTFGEPGSLIFILSYALLLVGLLLAVYGLYCLVAELWRTIATKEYSAPLIMMSIYYLTLMPSQIKFSFSYPHICTMDFRYIAPTMIISVVAIGLRAKRLFSDGRHKAEKAALSVCACLFCVLSPAVYMLLSGIL